MNRIFLFIAGLLGLTLPFLIDAALKGIVVLLLAGAISFILSQLRSSAATRHLVWLLALGSLLLLPTLSPLVPGWRVVPRWIAAMPSASEAIEPTAVSPMTIERRESRLPDAWLITREQLLAESPAILPSEPPRHWLSLVWAAGFVMLALRLLAAHALLWNASRRCVAVKDGKFFEVLEAARGQLSLRRPVQLLLDSRRTIPMVWGLFRPRLVLPDEASGWTETQLRSVLLHELAHVKRNDVASQWLMQLVCALYWFHPLVWLAAWRVRVESERACDDLVLAHGVRPSDYAEHVLHVATRLSPLGGVPAAGLAMARSSRLEGRMLAVLNERLNRRGVTRTLILTGLAMGLCVTIPVAMLQAADEKKPEPPAVVEVPAPPAPPATPAPPVIPQPPVADPLSPDESATVGIAVDGSLSINGKSFAPGNLQDEFKRLRNANPGVRFEVRAATGAPFERVVKVIDALEAVGAQEVRFATSGEKPEKAEKADKAERAERARQRQAERELREASELQRRELSRADDEKARQEAELVRSELERAKSDMTRAKLRQAESQMKRMEKLHAEQLVGGEELGQAALDVSRLRAESAGDLPEKARAELQVALAELALNEAKLKRAAELADKNLVPQSELEAAKAEAEVARAKTRVAKAQLNNVEKSSRVGREWPKPNPAKKERLLQILGDEIKIAEEQAKLVRTQQAAGAAGPQAALRADLDVLSLKRERAALEGDNGRVTESIADQIRVLYEMEKVLREEKKGAAGEVEALQIRRQILSLQRQQAQLE